MRVIRASGVGRRQRFSCSIILRSPASPQTLRWVHVQRRELRIGDLLSMFHIAPIAALPFTIPAPGGNAVASSEYSEMTALSTFY
jgi:hypothetical protein